MINLDSIIGDVIFISFRNIDRLKNIGITESSGHFLLKGYDQIGLWLEHPGIEKIEDVDKKGKPIPVNKRKKEVVEGVFLMLWSNIITILHFPNRDGFDFPGRLNHDKIGFKNE